MLGEFEVDYYQQHPRPEAVGDDEEPDEAEHVGWTYDEGTREWTRVHHPPLCLRCLYCPSAYLYDRPTCRRWTGTSPRGTT